MQAGFSLTEAGCPKSSQQVSFNTAPGPHQLTVETQPILSYVDGSRY